jgi:hypothetical protein
MFLPPEPYKIHWNNISEPPLMSHRQHTIHSEEYKGKGKGTP